MKVEDRYADADYTCANLLAILSDEGELELSSLLPKIAEWRENLMHLSR